MLALASASAAATTGAVALDLPEAQRLAVQRSQAIPAQQAAAEAARARAVAAAQRPDPILRLGLDNLPVEGGTSSLLTREPTTARSVGIQQALPDADKRAARGQLFEREADQALARLALASRTAAREAGLAWLNLRAAQQRLAVIEAQRGEAGLLRETTEAVYRGGRGSPADLFTARAAQLRLDDQRLQAQAMRDQARASLRRWLGDAADRPTGQAPTLDRPAGPAPLDADPELQLAAARTRSAEAAVALAREDLRPDWSVDLRFQQRGPRFDNMVTLGLSLPLRWDRANRQDREVFARLAQLRQAEAEHEEIRRARDADLDRWHASWRAGMDRLAVLDTQRQPVAADRVQAALAAYRAGSGSLQAVLEARQAELALQLERVQIELETASDRVRLDTIVPLPEATP